jgi:hypothetical protein
LIDLEFGSSDIGSQSIRGRQSAAPKFAISHLPL